MTTLRAAAQRALVALEDACGDRCNAEYNPCWQREVAETLKAALAEPEGPCPTCVSLARAVMMDQMGSA